MQCAHCPIRVQAKAQPAIAVSQQLLTRYTARLCLLSPATRLREFGSVLKLAEAADFPQMISLPALRRCLGWAHCRGPSQNGPER